MLVACAEIFASQSGGRVDVLSDIAALNALGASVVVVLIGEDLSVRCTDETGNLGISESQVTATSFILFSGFLSVERFKRTRLALLAAGRKKVLNIKDFHSLREHRAETARGKEAKVNGILARELAVFRFCDLVLSYSDTEVELIRRMAPDVRVRKHAIAIDAKISECGFKPELRNLVFIGNFDHAPNADGILWLAVNFKSIFAELGFTLHVFGHRSKEKLKFAADAHIRIHGSVEHVGDIYSHAGLFIAPLRFGAGIKVKLIEAAFAAVPIAATPMALEGSPLRPNTEVLCFDDADQFQSCLHRYIETPDQLRKLAAQARTTVTRHYSKESVRQSMANALQTV